MSPRREDDDGGPSDEEGSSASEQIQRTPSSIEAADASVEDLQNPAATNDVEEDNTADNSKYGVRVPVDAKRPQLANRGESSGYESFGGETKSQSPSVSTFKGFKHENDTPDDESLSKPKSRIASKVARGQVLVHYHPQLGDEGFESTLVVEPEDQASITSPSRGRPMDESSYYSGGGAAGMNSRMMDDVRVEKMAYYNSQPPSSPMNDHMNDEHNNAATRQIRRRVFRAALERGSHDERRKKMLDADADIGGPGSTSYRQSGAMNLTRRSRDADDEDIPQMSIKPSMSTMTPPGVSESFSPDVSTQQQTTRPPAPPAGPPSYRTIIQKLIKDNEPQKLPQLDKVLAKYKGREEELITKLDARYKKRKQKSDAILNDLEKIQKGKDQVSVSRVATKSGEGKQGLEDHGDIKQMNSWGSKTSKDVYFVKVTEPSPPGAIKMPSDIIDSNKTAPHSNVRAALAMEDEEDGDIPSIPKCDAAPAEVAAAAAANEEKLAKLKTVEDAFVEKEETISPLNEPYKFIMAPSYGDGISVITMETKGTLKTKKNDRGEDTYSWLQRPPNSITVEGGSGSNIVQEQESPLSPERKSKLNKLLPDFDEEKEEDKAKASEAKLESVALNNVESRIRARRKIMEEEAKKKEISGAVVNEDVNTKIEKGSNGFSKADTPSIVEDAESFVGKHKPTVSASKQADEVQPSLIDQQELLLQATAPQSTPGTEMQTASLVGGGDDLDDEEEIDLLLKESRLQAEKAIALRKAQRELEKEKKARIEAEAARLAVEEELARLKADAGIKQTISGDPKPIALHEENVVESNSDEDEVVDIAAEEHGDTPEEPSRYDLNNTTLSSVSDTKSEQESVEKSRSSSSDDMKDEDNAPLLGTFPSGVPLPLADTDRVLPDEADIAEASVESVASSQNELAVQESSDEDDDLSALKYLVLDGGGDSPIDNAVAPKLSDDMMEEAVDEVKESSLSTSPLNTGDIVSPPSDVIATKKMDDRVDQSLGQGATQRSEHDFPSTTMAHAPLSQDVLSEQEGAIDEEANINHVATTTFEGNRAKGQLSFTTGSKVLAHSNQRGPWWLGRCGGRTGWFPANAVVPESEFLKNIASALPTDIEETNDRLGELSNEELAATYDLIRNPSDPVNNVDNDEDDEDVNASPARSRWLDDNSSKNAVQSSRSDSPPPTRSDPSKMEGLNERLYPNESDAVDFAPQLGFEGMNRLGKSIEERQEERPKKTYIGPPQVITEADSPKIIQTSSGSQSKKKKKPQEWKATQDPSTGLTYYYHLKTREVSCIAFWLYLFHFSLLISQLRYLFVTSSLLGKSRLISTKQPSPKKMTLRLKVSLEAKYYGYSRRRRSLKHLLMNQMLRLPQHSHLTKRRARLNRQQKTCLQQQQGPWRILRVAQSFSQSMMMTMTPPLLTKALFSAAEASLPRRS